MGTATAKSLKGAFRGGRGDYILGTHPLWELARTPYQMSAHPIIIGAWFRLAGFLWAMLTAAEKEVPEDLVRFRRGEQMRRLREFFKAR
jgi:DNA replication initiation complex subunit (GINS family)